jgi:NAD(P) transhydrogenase subunit alpha
MIIGVPKESFPGERRVALVPSVLPTLEKAEFEIVIEKGAGEQAGFLDSSFQAKGAKVLIERSEVFSLADIIAQVRCLGANTEVGRQDLELLRKDQVIIGLQEPLDQPKASLDLANCGVISFALELVPRIARAQSMDCLSSMATISGYKAVLIAAESLPKMFPLLMTAAGTITPAHVLIIGVGVAGLQAIATARRLGAMVSAYDIRPAVKEQVASLGAKFIELELEAGDAEDKGGYAKAMDEEFYKKQRELMGRVVAESDVVITTALIPGKKAPVLVTSDMVKGMKPGSIVVDIAAERGGNCELTKPGGTTVTGGVKIMGPLNIPSTIPYHASGMYAKNITNFITQIIKDRKIRLDEGDQVVDETLVARGGQIVNSRVKELLG